MIILQTISDAISGEQVEDPKTVKHCDRCERVSYSYWAMMTIMPTPSSIATTSITVCLREEPSSSSGITDTVAM